MARTESKVRDLVASDPAMRDAVEVVLDRADDGYVNWVDVRDDISSGQWGRLIETGVLVDGEEGFELANIEATRAALDIGSEADDTAVVDTGSDEEIEEASWSTYDKAAALVSVALFAGYSWAPMRNLIGGAMDIVLGPLGELLPFYVIVIILSTATGLYSTILQANLMNTERIGKYQEQMKAIQEKRKDAKERGDDEALERIQEEQMDAMGDQLGMFKEQFRPMVWIMFLTIPVFLWMYWAIGIGGGSDPVIDLHPIVLPLIGQTEWTSKVLGPMQTWIIWYFICSMAFTQILRKALDINISPTSS